MKNKNILQITQIKIVLPGNTIELSAEEARKVYEELGKLFMSENKTELEKFKEEWEKLNPPQPYPVYVPYHPPIIIEKYIKEPHWTYPVYNPTTLPEFQTTCLAINLTE